MLILVSISVKISRDKLHVSRDKLHVLKTEMFKKGLYWFSYIFIEQQTIQEHNALIAKKIRTSKNILSFKENLRIFFKKAS